MKISICVNVQVDRNRKRATFAYWIAYDQGKISLCGPIKQAMNATDARMQGIYQALVALQQSSIAGGMVTIYGKQDWRTVEIEYLTHLARILQQLKAGGRFDGFDFRPFTGRIDPLNQDRIDWCVRTSTKLLADLVGGNL